MSYGVGGEFIQGIRKRPEFLLFILNICSNRAGWAQQRFPRLPGPVASDDLLVLLPDAFQCAMPQPPEMSIQNIIAVQERQYW